MNKIKQFKSNVQKQAEKAALIVTGVAVAASAGTAGATGEWDLSGAQTTVETMLGIGAVIAVGFAVFKLAKRGTGRV